MNYWETVQAVRAFLGWSHIPDFEYSATDGDRSGNPWKGKINFQPMTGFGIRWRS